MPPFWWVDFSAITPYASPLSYLARGIAALPLARSSDTTIVFQLLRGIPALVDSIRTGLEQRDARGIRLAREALPASTALIRGFDVAGSANPFAVKRGRLTMMDSATAAAVAATSAQLVDHEIAPAVERLLSLLTGPYATRTPTKVGLAQYPGGAAYYAWLVRWNTTFNTTPKAVHAIGVTEVARIEREMAAIRADLGFQGTKAEFHAQLAKDPRFFATTPEEFGERLASYATRLDPLLDSAFSKRPARPW